MRSKRAAVQALGHYRTWQRAALVWTGCFLIWPVFAAGNVPPSPPTVNPKPLVFFAQENSPPFSYFENGQVRGRVVDVSAALGRVLGRDTRVELTNSSLAQQLLLRDQGDGLFINVSDERRQVYDFTDGIFTSFYGIFVRSDNRLIGGIGDLAGKTVGVTESGYARQYFSTHPEINLVIIQNYEDGFGRLASGSIDAIATSTWLASYSIQQHRWGNFVLAGPPFASVPECIAIKKGNTELLAQLNRAIQDLKADGTIARIEIKWRPQEMLFVSRQRAQRYVVLIVGSLLAVLLAAMSLWVVTLKRYIRNRKKAEEHIRMLVSALGGASDCISLSDASDRIVYVNDAFLRQYEYEEQEILGKPATILSAPNNDPAILAEILPASMASGWRGQLWNISKTGRIFLISLATAPIRYETGNIIGFVGVARDITEERVAQEALRTSEEKFALAFKQSPSPVVLARMKDRKFVDVNDSFLNFYGATKEEVIGRTALELGLWVYPDERSRILQLIESQGRLRNEEVTLQTRSGERRKMLFSGDIINIGSEKWLLVTAEDVTTEREAREALHHSELKYRDLFENANDVIFTTTIAGRLTSINKKGQQLLGVSAEKAEGLNAPDLFSEAGAAEYRLNAARLQWREPVHTFEATLKHRRGPNPVILEMGLRLIFENGTAAGVQAVGRDVTERRQLEAQLLQAQKMEALGALAGGVAHDFNNLLTVIKGYSVLAFDILDDHEKLREALKEIGGAADRGAGLTSQLLAFSRQQISRRSYFRVDEAISGMEKMLCRVLGEDVQLVAKLSAPSAIIQSDPTQFDQVLLNLAVNARDAMPRGGKLEFSSEMAILPASEVSRLPLKSGEYVVITATDTGCGMDATTMNRIFEPFFTTKPAGKGTGLGLSTVYGIMKQNGGHISVTSEIYRGTTFKLYFPISRPSSQSQLPELPFGSSTGNETVLVVDDDAALRQLSSKVLESMGYRVLCAAGMQEAERLLYEYGGDIHLLITDVVMPGGGGEVLVDKFSKLRPAAGVLFMSGYTDGRIPQQYLIGNHPAFLPKPFTPAQLAEKVREMLNSLQC